MADAECIRTFLWARYTASWTVYDGELCKILALVNAEDTQNNEETCATYDMLEVLKLIYLSTIFQASTSLSEMGCFLISLVSTLNAILTLAPSAIHRYLHMALERTHSGGNSANGFLAASRGSPKS